MFLRCFLGQICTDRRHCLRWLFWGLMAMGLSGCIFIRLSRVLVQMKEPQRFLVIEDRDDLFRAELISPIVLLSDLEKLLGKKAVKVENHWRFVFAKAGPQDRMPWSIKLWTDKKTRVVSFEMPQKLSQVMGNDFILKAIEAIGRAEVSVGKRRIYMELEAEVRAAQVQELMGVPLKVIPSEEGTCRWYEFGRDETAFVVKIYGEEDIRLVTMESNGYGLEVLVQSVDESVEAGIFHFHE